MLKVIQYWDTGVDGMPPIIRYIYERNLKMSQKYGFELLLITKQNIKQYIKVPFGFFQLKANFQSDICRFMMLHKYGGIWLDTDAIILNDMQPLFDELNHSKYDMTVFHGRLSYPAECAFIAAKSNTICSKYTVDYIKMNNRDRKFFIMGARLNRIFEILCNIISSLTRGRIYNYKISFQWAEMGPRCIKHLMSKYPDKVLVKDWEATHRGLSFIHWIQTKKNDNSQCGYWKTNKKRHKKPMMYSKTRLSYSLGRSTNNHR